MFAELLRGKPYDNYCNVVTFMCQDASNAVAADNLDASGMSMVSELPIYYNFNSMINIMDTCWSNL